MKKLFIFLAAVAVSGCAVDSTGPTTEHLRKLDNLRTERTLEMTFPEIQMALFRHTQECGSGPIFEMKEGQTSYATIHESADTADLPWNQVLLVDLMWLQSTWRYDTRTRVHVYSYYSDADVKQRIDAIFNAVLKPGQCHPDSEDADVIS